MPRKLEELPKNPLLKASCISKYITYQWLNPLFKKGNKQPLKSEDFYEVPPEDETEHIANKLERQWNKEQERAKTAGRRPKLSRAVAMYLGRDFMMVGLLNMLEEFMRIGMPYFIGRFISYFVPGTTTTRLQAALYGGVIICFSYTLAVIHHPLFFIATRYGMQLKNALATLVYRKAIRLSQNSMSKTTTGHIVNLMTSDVQILERTTIFLHQTWLAPLLLIVAAVLSWLEMGPWSFTGILALLLLAPLQGWMGKQFALLRQKTATMTDLRFKIMSEVIAGMRVIKMYTWEKAFSNLVADVRGNFLQMEDKKMMSNNRSTKTSSTTSLKPVVEVEKISAKWNESLNTQTLTDISFKVTPGELLMIVGPVGAGKSSLLMALLGELQVSHGVVNVQGNISYASQQSWIFSGTVKENILFDQEYDKERYDRVIKKCALEKFNGYDIVLCPRAVYYDAEIVLLDDPLSAVDTNVGRKLFDECIRGLLKDRICILVTHQLQYLKGATNIICLKDGHCVGKGTFEELNEGGLDVMSLMSTLSDQDVMVEQEAVDLHQNESDHHVVIANGKTPLLEPNHIYKRSTSAVSEAITETRTRKSHCDLPSSMSMETLNDSPEEIYVSKQEAEKQTTGTVTWNVYLNYLKAGSSLFGMIVLAILVLASQGSILVGEWWLAEWADSEHYVSTVVPKKSNSTFYLPFYDRDTYIIVYGVLVVVGMVTNLLSFVLLFRLFVLASKNLHNNMFNSVLRAPIYFFDTNPVGRVLNRFAKDISQMDDLLPSSFSDFVRLSVLTFAILLLNVVSIPYLLVGALPMTILFGYLRNYYLKTSRDIKRLEAINRSPVYSHVSASLDGLMTIRAFNAEERFIDSFYDYQNYHSAGYFLFLTTQRWLGARLDVMCASFMALAVIGSMVTFETGTALSASVVGLCLTYAKMLTGMFQWCTRQSAEVENIMTSVERVIEYSQLEPEAEPSKPLQIPRDWPSNGVISAERLYYSHHKTLPPVLKNLNFCIKSEEKVGIVGRTGAGKSSLLSMLFRLNNPEGLVQIDSLTITDLSLHDLRSAISIIPQ
ncbi:multidrug resistance-associated protein 4-like, partial [Actinia tenebrosa]|uniref:Multidrug resistance-associated protein 4-like n=1 Tax=Actinia tenebrosa TaxID=6105 RepID=A0A6P8I1U7_ACTTE